MILLNRVAAANEERQQGDAVKTPIHGYVWLSMETARQLGTAFTFDLPGFAQIKSRWGDEFVAASIKD